MNSTNIKQIRFYNGLSTSIDKTRMTKFEQRSITDRFYSGGEVNTETVIEELGPTVIHYSNVQPWGKEIPDIDNKSARTFSIWAEDEKTKDIVTTARGFYVLIPLQWGKETIQEYYSFSEHVPYYPVAVVSSFLTIIDDKVELNNLIEKVKEEIQQNWQSLRQEIIKTLDRSDLWKRYVLSFENIIHFSFLCSAFDRELVNALRKNNYRITGALQMLASPTYSYDKAMVVSHLNKAKEIIDVTDTVE
jgi:hypothetical protein